jgi:hypothetical protein
VAGLIGMVSLEVVGEEIQYYGGTVQKETASLLKGDCRAKATHPSAVDYMPTKQQSEIDRKAVGKDAGLINQGQVL